MKQPDSKLQDQQSATLAVLHLSLHKEWFDLIAMGKKKTEIRRCGAYWRRRLWKRHYDVICFRNGYGKSVPEVIVEFLGVELIRQPKPHYAIRLGRIIDIRRWQPS